MLPKYMGCIHEVKHKKEKEKKGLRETAETDISALPHCILAPQSTKHFVPSKDTILGTEEQLSKTIPYFPRVTTQILHQH